MSYVLVKDAIHKFFSSSSLLSRFFPKTLQDLKPGFPLKRQNQNSGLFQHHKKKNPTMHLAKLQTPELF